MKTQTAEVETNENKEKLNIENKENNSNLKDILDKYEDLVDKYVDLLKKTSQGSYDTSAYGEYLKVLQEYTELSDEVNKIDTSKLSKEDYNYYLEVTQRVLNKISSVYTK